MPDIESYFDFAMNREIGSCLYLPISLNNPIDVVYHDLEVANRVEKRVLAHLSGELDEEQFLDSIAEEIPIDEYIDFACDNLYDRLVAARQGAT